MSQQENPTKVFTSQLAILQRFIQGDSSLTRRHSSFFFSLLQTLGYSLLLRISFSSPKYMPVSLSLSSRSSWMVYRQLDVALFSEPLYLYAYIDICRCMCISVYIGMQIYTYIYVCVGTRIFYRTSGEAVAIFLCLRVQILGRNIARQIDIAVW